MQILRQLPPSYHSIVDMITNTKPLPSFVEAKNILILHEARKQSIDPTSDASLTSSAALYSSHLPLENGNINLIKAKIMGDLLPGVILMFLITLILLQVLKVLKVLCQHWLPATPFQGLLLLLSSFSSPQLLPLVFISSCRALPLVLSNTTIDDQYIRLRFHSIPFSHNNFVKINNITLPRIIRHLLEVMLHNIDNRNSQISHRYFKWCRSTLYKTIYFIWIPGKARTWNLIKL